ncbi:MAG: transcriptional regulator, AraC family [Bradyrhizobium sp.]|nr:transcriptional regulator, AraC family [Bradyrhizobium sp.]
MDEMAYDFAALPLPRSEATFTTSDMHEGMRYISETSRHTLRPLDARSAVELRHWGLSLENIQLNLVELTCGSEFRMEKTAEAGHYLFQLPISGICEMQVGRSKARASAGQIFAHNPGDESQKRWIGSCTQLMVRVDRHAFGRVLSSELDRECREPVIFDRSIQGIDVGRALGALSRSIWQDVSYHAPLRQWRVTRSFERNFLVGCLGLLPHNYSEEFCRPVTSAAPYYVRRAEDYIRANLRSPIEIEDLVAVAGVSSRSLYYGFRRWRGTTPMSYLRNMRLSLAHEELKHARDAGVHVTRVALGVGYDHLSRFSKDYKQRFGQSPSVTLRQVN